jgi:hypothetical protein
MVKKALVSLGSHTAFSTEGFSGKKHKKYQWKNIRHANVNPLGAPFRIHKNFVE